MFVESSELQPDSIVEGEVCIIGSGAAGMTIARELMGKQTRVIVLESGGHKEEDEIVDLSKGKNVSRKYHPLHRARSRFFGGSTNCWAGLCAPLDPIDFEQRDWLPHSGWPFDRATLEPYYQRAHEHLRLGPHDYTPKSWEEQGAAFDFGPDAPIESAVFQGAQGARRMGKVFRKEFERAKDVTVYLHANVTSIDLVEGGTAVDSLTCKVLDGPTFKVRAKYFVLAAGGLENPRILLASNAVQSVGIGNQHDLVGRFFMEHPHTDHESFLVGSPGMMNWEFYKSKGHGERKDRRYKTWGYLRVKDEVLRREQIVNVHSVVFDYEQRARKIKHKREYPLLDAMMPVLADTDGDRGQPAGVPEQTLHFTFGTPSESAPNPESRVTLSTSDKDAFGIPRIELHWKLLPIDKRSIRRMHELMAESFGRAGLGRMYLTLTDDDEQWPPQMHGGWHHMGTTRMHDDPKQGVCDADGYVHGVSNLLVAGSSLFPTSGAANPTFTIMALAIRMADHIEGKLK
ncbi:MAG: GMC family oxidoreductase [Enhygromyxa sp.]